MRIGSFLIVIFGGILAGCTVSSMNSSTPSAVTSNQQLIPGVQYEVFTNRPDESNVSYFGKLSESSPESITLDNVVLRTETKPNLKLPMIGGLFKSVGGTAIEGPVTIERSKISKISVPNSP